MKAFSVRLDDKSARKFVELCRKTGCKKSQLIARLIEAYVESQTGGHSGKGRIASHDPFRKVIGLMNVKPRLLSENEIDRALYRR